MRYIARPALSGDRLRRLPDGRVALRLKRPFANGATHVFYTPQTLIERLAALIPRPRSHRVRYHGVLAPASPLRAQVVPDGQKTTPPRPRAGKKNAPPERRRSFRWILWAELLRRVFQVDALRCPRCAGRMNVIAAIVKADVIAAILKCLGLPSAPPSPRLPRPPPDLVEIPFP